MKLHKEKTQTHTNTCKHPSKYGRIVFSVLLWFPCILGKLAARPHSQSDQLFRLPWALWVFPGFIRSSCWKFGTMKNMMHGERDKYHRDPSAMCHLMPSRERENCKIWFSKQQMGWYLCFSKDSMLPGKSLASCILTSVVDDGKCDTITNCVWDMLLLTGKNEMWEKDSVCVCLPEHSIYSAQCMCAHTT